MSAKAAPTTRRFHVLETGLTVPVSRDSNAVLSRGQHFSLTPELYELSKDRNGESVYDLSPAEQVSRWGIQRFAEGDAPEDIAVGDDSEGHVYHLSQRELEEAARIADKTARAARTQEIKRKYAHVISRDGAPVDASVRPTGERKLR